MYAGAGIEHRLRRHAPGRASLPARGRRRARRKARPPARRGPQLDRDRAPRRRRGAALGRALGRRGAAGGATMNILHVQKVAGISGSEAHLLQLLPDLTRPGWDIRFLMLHEQEPGWWELARE